MRKQILILIVSLILVTTIFAVGELTKSNSTITLSSANLNKIKATGIASINVEASPMSCDGNECWSDIYQGNLIQTQFRTPRSHCTEYSVIDKKCDTTNITERKSLNCYIKCIKMTRYSTAELLKARDTFIADRLSKYANTLRTTSGGTKIDGGGTITEK